MGPFWRAALKQHNYQKLHHFFWPILDVGHNSNDKKLFGCCCVGWVVALVIKFHHCYLRYRHHYDQTCTAVRSRHPWRRSSTFRASSADAWGGDFIETVNLDNKSRGGLMKLHIQQTDSWQPQFFPTDRQRLFHSIFIAYSIAYL